MRRFLASIWFPFLTCLVFAGAVTGAYVWLAPTGADIGNSEILKYAQMGAWAVGPVIALLSFIVIGILNTIRRIMRLRRVSRIHPLVVLTPLVFWLVVGWNIAGEPRYTPVAKAIIDFAARPMLVGSFVSVIFAVLISLPVWFPSKK